MNGADARFCLLTLHTFHLSKTSVISYTHKTLKVFAATRQNKSSV